MQIDEKSIGSDVPCERNPVDRLTVEFEKSVASCTIRSTCDEYASEGECGQRVLKQKLKRNGTRSHFIIINRKFMERDVQFQPRKKLEGAA